MTKDDADEATRKLYRLHGKVSEAMGILTGVCLHTYGRKPDMMHELPQWLHLQMAETECRKARDVLNDARRSMEDFIDETRGFKGQWIGVGR